jgi:hypothetical protein
MSSSALLATWFGSETILGASEEFLKNGLIAWVVCLIADQEIIGLFVGLAASLVGLILGTWSDSLVKTEIEHV